VTTFRYLTAAEWGGTWDGEPRTEKLLDPELYVHHVGGGAWMGGTVPLGLAASRAAAIDVFQDLNAYAKNTKGYQFLDYDALVWYDRFNDIVWIAEGRGEYMSAATRDRNELGEAIVLCGNTALRAPLPAELEGIARAIVWAAQRGWIAGTATILGHRDNPAHPNATSCPGKFLYAQLPAIRRRVAELLTPTPSTGGHVLLYRVVENDGYWAIARKVYASAVTLARVLELQAANGNKTLKPGDLVNIPGRLP
jgi:hypothetical protein